jgi:DNA-binding MarR family transcriptional regulator
MGVLPGLMGFMLRQAQLLVYQDFQQSVGPPAVRPPQFSILELVHRNPGIRPSELSLALGVSRANLVPLLADLVAQAWVTRSGDKNDGRAQALHITQAGLAVLRRLHRSIVPHEDRLAERLGPQGRAQLLALLHGLVRGQ